MNDLLEIRSAGGGARPDPVHGLVAQHFAALTSHAADLLMWQHLRTCSDCRGRYRTQVLLEALERDGVERARARLGPRMLDEQRLIQRDRRRWVQLVAACALSILARDSIKEGPDVRPPPVPRTGESRAPAGPRLFIYVAGRASDMEINVRVGALIRSSDALAFAFINPSDGRGRSHLMIFAHDPTGRVYWFWPDWQDESVNPAALPIPHSDDAVELGEAVRHSFAEGPLTVVGLFSDRAWSAREVEATLAAGGPFAAADTDIWTETLEVVP